MNFNYPIYPLANIREDAKEQWSSNHSALFLVYMEEDVAQAPFLEKVLEAVGVDKHQVIHWVVKGREVVPVPALLQQSQSNKVIVFGLPLSQVCFNINTKKYQLVEMQDKQWLWADDLIRISQNKDLKKSLWVQLKLMFGI